MNNSLTGTPQYNTGYCTAGWVDGRVAVAGGRAAVAGSVWLIGVSLSPVYSS